VGYYREAVEKQMKEIYLRLSEKHRRRYAAVEAAKLDHGGQQYIAQLFGVDCKTIRQGQADLELTEDVAGEKLRKKAAGGSASST
jgi:ribosomal protein L6P/L9E